MRAGQITVSTRAFAVVDVPTPDAGAGQVRIKVEAAGVCLSDVHLLEGILSPGYLDGDQVTLGHEVAGVVDQVGLGVTTSAVGDRVVVIAGQRNAAQQITTMGFDYNGGWAEYVVTRCELVAAIPDSLPFEQAAIMTADGSMNDPENCSGYYVGQGTMLANFREPGLMIGTFYDAATELLGLGPGTTKAGVLMGLASYGKVSGKTKKNADEWIKPLWDRNSPIQDNQYIDWLFSQITGRFPFFNGVKEEIINGDNDAHFFQRKWQTVFKKGDYNKQEVMDFAADVQYLCERAMVKYSQQLFEETKDFNGGNLCLAGGVALNCNANFKVKIETDFENIHFFPACGDDGISVGAALWVAHMIYGYPRVNYSTQDLCYLGMDYDYQPKNTYEYVAQDLDLALIAEKVSEGEILCWYQGRSELGPRALGNRSFVTDPRYVDMKDTLNAKVKFREWFRPFAPVVLNEQKEEWFDMDFESPYMLYTVPCKRPQEIPSVAHIDNSSRVQTLTKDHNPRFYTLIEEFSKITGIPVVMNTSLNVKGEPIVETPEDAMKLFHESDVNLLVINDKMYIKK